jgi:hypothetical protein
MTAISAPALTAATVVPIGKSRKTTTHVSATGNFIAATSVKRSRVDTTPNLGFKLVVTMIIATGIVTGTITKIRIAAGVIGIVTAPTAALTSCAKPR